MGADFVYATFPRFERTEERQAALQEIAQSIGIVDLDGKGELDINDKGEVAELRKQLSMSIDSVHSHGDSRDCCIIDRGTHHAWISGGMSWGDPPTEAYDCFQLLQRCLPLYDKAMEFAIEDQEKHRVWIVWGGEQELGGTCGLD